MPVSSPPFLLLVLLGLVLAAPLAVAAGWSLSAPPPKTSVVEGTGGGSTTVSSAKWRRLEDEVAPELPSGISLLRGGIDVGALNKDSAVCLHQKCSQPAQPYTGRGCFDYYQCHLH